MAKSIKKTAKKIAKKVVNALSPKEPKENVPYVKPGVGRAKNRGKKVLAKVRALAQGQHGGTIIQPGEVFVYDGYLKEVDGEFYFPRWIEAPKGYQNLDEVGMEDSEDEDDELEEGEVIEADDEEGEIEGLPLPDRATVASRPTVKGDSKVKPLSPKERALEQQRLEQESAENSGEDLI